MIYDIPQPAARRKNFRQTRERKKSVPAEADTTEEKKVCDKTNSDKKEILSCTKSFGEAERRK